MSVLSSVFSLYIQAAVILLPLFLPYAFLRSGTSAARAGWFFHRAILVLYVAVAVALCVLPRFLPPVGASSDIPAFGIASGAPEVGIEKRVGSVESTGTYAASPDTPAAFGSGVFFSAVSGMLTSAGRRTADLLSWCGYVAAALSAAGFAAFLTVFFRQRSFLRRLRRTAAKTSRIGRIEIVYSPGVESPFVCGAFAPRIYLPESFVGTPLRRIVIIHEMTHVRQNHLVWRNIEYFLKTVFWYNPLSHVMERTGELLRELVCDLKVTDRIPRKFYLQALVDCAGLVRTPVRRFGCQGMASKGMLRKRVENLVNTTGEKQMSTSLKSMFMFTALCCLALFGTAILSAQAIDPGRSATGAAERSEGIRESVSWAFANPDKPRVEEFLRTIDWKGWMADLSDDERAGVPGIWPVGSGNGKVTWDYGHHEEHPLTGKPCYHSGIDIARGYGEPILVSATGRVLETGNDEKGHGLYVLVEHSLGFRTFYAHLGSIAVKRGAAVTRGEKIGTMGSTGVSTGPHVHYEIRAGVADATISPWHFLPAMTFASAR